MKRATVIVLGLILMFGLIGLAARADEDTQGRRITLELKDTPIRSALEYLFKGTGFNFVVAQDVKGNVSSIDLKGVSFEVALKTLLKSVDPPLVYRKDGDVYLISVKKEVPAIATPEAQPADVLPAVLKSDDVRIEKISLNFVDAYDLRTFLEGGDISNNPFGPLGMNGAGGYGNQNGGYGPYGQNGGYYPGGGGFGGFGGGYGGGYGGGNGYNPYPGGGGGYNPYPGNPYRSYSRTTF